MAARDFEDMLQVGGLLLSSVLSYQVQRIQCAIPVFEGLIPGPHNKIILWLLFLCAHWHGLAKLRMHTDTTLAILDEVTADLGKAMRHFKQKVCGSYHTKELPGEIGARQRRQQKASGTGAKKTAACSPALRKEFNIQTYKHHSLDDFMKAIRWFGTTDSFSTTVVSDIYQY